MPAFILLTLVLGLFCSAPGVIWGRFLAAKGLVRERSVEYVIVTVGAVVLVCFLLSFSLTGWLMLAVLTFLGPGGYYRYEVWITSKKGKGWWLQTPSDRWASLWYFGGLVMAILLAAWRNAGSPPLW